MNISFRTETGIEVPAVTSAQMREIDRIAIEETGPNLYQMMENAGRNLALEAIEMLGSHWQKARIIILAGKGGNVGGGICAARHLANRGIKVSLVLSSPDNLSEIPAWQHTIYRGTNGNEIQPDELEQQSPDFIIDALLGYSLTGAPRGIIIDLIKWANGTKAPILSLDIPSGLDATTGQTIGEYITASRTITLALPKTGLVNKSAGDIFLGDIGIPRETFRLAGINYTSPFGKRFRIPLYKS